MIEIERKFLVRELPEAFSSFPSVEILQGYLAIDPSGAEVRLRKAGDEYCLTAKRRCPDGREEHNVSLSREDWERLWPMTSGRRLSKVRFDLPYGRFTIEVDVFGQSNEGLVIAEVEFPDVETERGFQPPPWFGEEVTDDPGYSNQQLAVD